MSKALVTPTPVAARHDLAATAAERREAGRQSRVLAPREEIGDWDERNRGHDAIETITAQNDIRLPELVPLRHQRMALSPWNYYRGAAAVMAADLASRPHSRIEVQLCGDAHVLNYGLWATPERQLNFDLRDFDETLPGPFEWDVARLAASLVVAARENAVKAARADAAVTAAVDAYRSRMRRYAAMPEIDIWYDATLAQHFIDSFEPADRGQVKVRIEKGKEKRTSRGAFAKLTTMARGRPRITADPPLRVTIDDSEQQDIVDHLLSRVPPHAPGGPPDAVRPLHPGGRGPPGGGGRQRRHGRLPRALHGPLRRRPPLLAVQAGRAFGLRAEHLPEQAREPRRPRRSRASGWCRARRTSSSAGDRWPVATSTCASTAT